MRFIVPGQEIAHGAEMSSCIRAAAYRNGKRTLYVAVNISGTEKGTFKLPRAAKTGIDFFDGHIGYGDKNLRNGYTLPPLGTMVFFIED